MKLHLGTFAFFYFAFLATAMAQTTDAQRIIDGKAFAEQNCARCHVIGDFNPNGGISSTPSFQLLVNALKDYEERFDTFYLRPPHPAAVAVEGIKKLDELPYNAVPVQINLEQVKNIAAFVKTLKKK